MRIFFSIFTLLVFSFLSSASATDRHSNSYIKIQDAIRAALEANHNSRTLAEWKNSGKTPEAVFSKIFEMGSPQAVQDFCTALSDLPIQDLTLFEHALEESHTPLYCQNALLARLAVHWKHLADAQKKALTRNDDRPHQNSPFQNPLSLALDDPNAPTLPNSEIPIDPTQVPALANGGLPKGQVALTFDDGPHPDRTARILEILHASSVRAGFFELGENAQNFPEISKQVTQAGHIVGSHSWNHPNLPTLPLDEAKDQILNGQSAVNNATGTEIPFFRFPYGSSSPELRSFIQDLGLTRFFWNMDSLDWKIRDPDQLFANILLELNREQRGIILFHDIHEQTVLVLPRFLRELKNRGFSTVVFVPKP